MRGGHFESVDGRQLIISIGRRLMALGAAFVVENLFPASDAVVERVRIRRRFERVDKSAERIHRLVGMTEGEAALFFREKTMRTNGAVICDGDEYAITCDIGGVAIPMRAGRVEIASVLHSDQI